MRAYLAAWRKYARIAGRSTRAEYWIFLLLHAGVLVLFAVADHSIGMWPDHGIGLLTALYLAVSMGPWMSVSIRRLHDIGFSGHWMWLGLVPIGWLALQGFMAQPSQPCRNRYGSVPVTA